MMVIFRLNRFFRKFSNVRIRYNENDEFEYSYLDEVVYIPKDLKTIKNTDIWFEEYAANEFGFPKDLGFVLKSILHEIGHHETIDSIDETKENQIKSKLSPSSKGDCMKYFALPTEYAATEWAYYFQLEHYNELIKLKEKLRLS